ncbi:MAG: hypothetical protein G01um1014107_276 [Parcubacteria group bacterium Gr01-1014_107]|nr:MAG: hypothetical protein G01um1014107_276 [Parcubacteria group bacterium Gr01-1014_107]
MKSFKFCLSAGLLLLLAVSFLFLTQESLAAPRETELFGTAWSSNIGWIRFNSCDAPNLNCGSASYKVVVDNRNGHVTGEAWSAGIGWIKFGGLSQFPSGDGTVAENAKINFSEGMPIGMTFGWARACAGTLPGDCSSMQSRSDGWDGWISLSGTNHPSPAIDGTGGVTYVESTGRIVGKAWGGEVVGWIDFVNVWFGPPPAAPFDFSLTNSTIENGAILIAQGGSGGVSVTRTLVSGNPENVTITALTVFPNPSPGTVSVTIETNNPCEPDPECSSILRIDVSPNVPLGNYSFVVRGVSESSLARDTTVTFRVEEREVTPTISSCEAERSPFWLYQLLTWKVEITDGTGNEEVSWEGDLGNWRCLNTQCGTIETFYSTVGPKRVRVSVDGEEFVDCPQIMVGVRAMFRQF